MEAPCRKRTGNQVPRAEKTWRFLITATQKVLSEVCESRNNHRHAVVVQDLATQWLESYPCKKQNLFRKPNRVCKSFSSRQVKSKVICTDSSLEFGKACED